MATTIKSLEFSSENIVYMNSEEVLSVIDDQNKVTITFNELFDEDSDSADVFRGVFGDERFEEIVNAMMDEDSYSLKHTFFISNSKEETPFNDRGMVKRLIKDNYWTGLILHDYPLKGGLYAMIVKIRNNDDLDQNFL
ncbi:hypothetical protein [Pseudobacillus badius]|uniref:hypothetical protein n=1 Tax=Bacillus badius TaxID=1455 RepID=UPI003D341A06